MTEDASHLKLALHRAWDEIAVRTYRHHAVATLTANEVRTAVQKRLAVEPAANENIRKFWLPLSENQRRDALAVAFPNGPYPAPPDRDEDLADADLLSD